MVFKKTRLLLLGIISTSPLLCYGGYIDLNFIIARAKEFKAHKLRK